MHCRGWGHTSLEQAQWGGFRGGLPPALPDQAERAAESPGHVPVSPSRTLGTPQGIQSFLLPEVLQLRFCRMPTSTLHALFGNCRWPAAQQMSRINLHDDIHYQVSGPCLTEWQSGLFLVCHYVGSSGGGRMTSSLLGNIPSPLPANSPSEPTAGPELPFPFHSPTSRVVYTVFILHVPLTLRPTLTWPLAAPMTLVQLFVFHPCV